MTVNSSRESEATAFGSDALWLQAQQARPSVTLADIFAELSPVVKALRRVRFSAQISHASSLLGVTGHLEESELPLDRFLFRLEKACVRDAEAAVQFYDFGPEPSSCLCCNEAVSAAKFDASRQICVACDAQFRGSRMGLFRS